MNLISTTDLRKKEIINLCDGARLGFACDFQFDKCSAQITALILEKNSGFLGFGNCENFLIPWCKIECIGEDTVLVKLDHGEVCSFCEPKKKKKLWD